MKLRPLSLTIINGKPNCVKIEQIVDMMTAKVVSGKSLTSNINKDNEHISKGMVLPDPRGV